MLSRIIRTTTKNNNIYPQKNSIFQEFHLFKKKKNAQKIKLFLCIFLFSFTGKHHLLLFHVCIQWQSYEVECIYHIYNKYISIHSFLAYEKGNKMVKFPLTHFTFTFHVIWMEMMMIFYSSFVHLFLSSFLCRHRRHRWSLF